MPRVIWIALAVLVLATDCRQAPKGSTITVVTASPVTSIDPQTTEDVYSISALTNVYEPLVRHNAEFKIVPQLALSWSNPTDNKWVFNLRKGVKFHDGSDFGATDVQYSIERGLKNPNSVIQAWVGSIRSVNVVNENTVELITARRSPLLLSWLTSVLMIRRNSDAIIGSSANGTGPYRVKGFSPGEQLELERFDSYWDQQPRWLSAKFLSHPDPRERIQMIEDGKAKLAEITESDAPIARSKVKLLEYPASQLSVLGFSIKQMENNVFIDPAVRRAIALSIDQEILIRESLHGMAKPVAQLAPFQAFGFDWEIPERKPDYQKAKQLLAPFGEIHSGLYFGASSKEIAQHIQRRLSSIGVHFELRQKNRQQFDDLLFQQDAPAYILQFGFPTMDTSDMLYDSFHTTTAEKNFGSLNFSGYSDAELDSILDKSSIELDPMLRYDLLKRAMKLALDSNIMIPLCIRSNLFAAAPGIQWKGNPSARITLEEISEQ